MTEADIAALIREGVPERVACTIVAVAEAQAKGVPPPDATEPLPKRTIRAKI